MTVSPHFAHFRVIHPKTHALSPHGGVTAWVVPHVHQARATLGLAVCSIHDTYNKRRGRAIAEGRHRVGKTREIAFHSSGDDRLQLAEALYEFASAEWAVKYHQHPLPSRGGRHFPTPEIFRWSKGSELLIP